MAGIYTTLLDSILTVRHSRFDSEKKTVCRASVPVISIGSLTIGGAGKTPLTLKLTEYLIEQGVRPAILSRGYRRKLKGPHILPDDLPTDKLAFLYGDEPAMYKLAFPEMPVIVSERRCHALPLIKDLPADVILLDDGFQHRAIHRDADILIFRKNFQGEHESYFPFGHLRDTLKRLPAAHVILAEEGSSGELLSYFRSRAAVVTYSRRTALPDTDRIRHPLTVFSGIADGNAFLSTLRNADIHPDRFVEFPDHASYTYRKLKALDRTGAVTFICTDKDRVKLPDDWLKNRTCLTVGLTIDIPEINKLGAILSEKTGLNLI